ncbi:type I secretion system permease/ATPase [Parashewanella curva]|uniref:Type I secretion system permease/ATPase n=1 Tax=Parashewanella curva TaxID=2338552 RepID=A0A3L8PVZ1_9GAMM|nr:type I secretion system permease/ATPase [Parashewanella curva]RLV59494.1 type I secretion system permease/ATPase [Parashewanella curva]
MLSNNKNHIIDSVLFCTRTLLRLSKIESDIAFSSTEIDKKSLKSYLSVVSKSHKVKARLKKLSFSKLNTLKAPISYERLDGSFSILAGISEGKALVQRADEIAPQVITVEELIADATGYVITIETKAFSFDITWFVPEFLKHKSVLSEIIIFSLFLQVLALILPLFFQVVMDKVLVHNALSTLDVLVFVLVIVGLFEVILKGLREYLLAQTTTKIDLKLGSKLLNHLVKLPLAYFKSRQVGAIVTRVRELDSIRNLITSSALTLLVDVSFLFVFIGVMFYLSPFLTSIVLASFPIYFLIGYVTSPLLKKRIEKQFACGAKNIAFLTESVRGVETVKSLAVEPSFNVKWEGQTEELVTANFKRQSLQAATNQSVTLIQKVISALIIWFGAMDVISLEMTIGQLVAFNMMVSHINQPISKLIELWQEFIQARVAVDNLAEVVNLPTEVEQEQKMLPVELKGNIQFKNICFRYQPQSPLVIDSLSFEIKSGQSIGIVGASGSGKSTISRLIQKLYVAESGDIAIDGYSLSALDASQLRKNIGIVMQENFLFNQTVRENISVRFPSANLEQVIEAAKLAGAHEFIMRLSRGYDTVLAEGGSSLSGGQKQRIAIARALLIQPSILIFDEATSALDDESQEIIQKNMAKIAEGRTVITIAHRLSTIKNCDQIMVINQGQLAEQGNHSYLLSYESQYKKLWSLQQELKAEC